MITTNSFPNNVTFPNLDTLKVNCLNKEDLEGGSINKKEKCLHLKNKFLNGGNQKIINF